MFTPSHFLTFLVACDVTFELPLGLHPYGLFALTPGLPLDPHPCGLFALNPSPPLGPHPYGLFALVASPKLRLRHLQPAQLETIDQILIWNDFEQFYAFITSFQELQAYAFHTYLDLAHFLESWDAHKRFKYVLLVGL